MYIKFLFLRFNFVLSQDFETTSNFNNMGAKKMIEGIIKVFVIKAISTNLSKVIIA